jgi:hypothetical protein
MLTVHRAREMLRKERGGTESYRNRTINVERGKR